MDKPLKKTGSDAIQEGIAPLHADKELSEETNKMLLLVDEAGIPPIDLSHYRIDNEIVKLIPEHIARAYRVMPLARIGLVLTVAMVDPFEVFVMDNLKIITKCNIQPVVAALSQLKKAQEDYYAFIDIGDNEPVKEDAVKEKEPVAEWHVEAEEIFNVQEVAKASQETAIINMVNMIIKDAIEMRASDIHIEPYADVLRLRLRIDGIMREMTPLFRENTNAIIARIKIMSGLDITICRLPQDGRFSSKLGEKEVDFRVSILPIHFGEKAVLRLLDKESITVAIEKLGFSVYAFNAFKEAIGKPHGMILLTGPTGSGKSTTLYSLLNRLNTPQRHIVTIEDPVEYHVRGLAQIQVKPDIGLSFAAALRAVLRQSPDIIMVGEIRDYETVDIAMKAALTGHIIFSTLHTNDAPSAIVRLMDMGVEPFLIASTLTLIAAQRLARKVCVHCKEKEEVSCINICGLPEQLKGKTVPFFIGKGCEFCNDTGYLGRVAIVEALTMDDVIRQMVLKRASVDQLRDYACAHGMKTLREDAVEKGLNGEISLEEILRVTSEE